MKQPIIFFLTIFLLAMSACKKYDFNGVITPASVIVINAMPTSHAMIPYFGKGPVQDYTIRAKVNYGASALFTPPIDSSDFFIRPVTNTSFTVFQGKFDLVSGGIYSFFLAGDTTRPDTILTKDQIIFYSDSSAGIRFVNLAAGGKTISINLVGNDPVSQREFSDLSYRNISSFKKYLANTSVTNYKFQIRDQVSGVLLTTYTWTYKRFQNNTIVIAGSTDPASGIPLKVFAVNHY